MGLTKQSNGWFLSCIFAIPLRSILWQKCNLKTTVYRGVMCQISPSLGIEMEKNELTKKIDLTKRLFKNALAMYHEKSCQCAFPRYLQIVSIDCSDTGNSFQSQDTELLIEASKPYFCILPSANKDEITNQKWVCKKCGSEYEYGWSDFSIYVQRQKLKLKKSKVSPIGKEVRNPIPLFLGLMGHSYPPKSEIEPVSFCKFSRYMKESTYGF
jgi:hypothetical protein